MFASVNDSKWDPGTLSNMGVWAMEVKQANEVVKAFNSHRHPTYASNPSNPPWSNLVGKLCQWIEPTVI